MEAGGAIFIGLIAPLYALTTNNRRRAVIFFAAYLVGMIVATELQRVVQRHEVALGVELRRSSGVSIGSTLMASAEATPALHA